MAFRSVTKEPYDCCLYVGEWQALKVLPFRRYCVGVSSAPLAEAIFRTVFPYSTQGRPFVMTASEVRPKYEHHHLHPAAKRFPRFTGCSRVFGVMVSR